VSVSGSKVTIHRPGSGGWGLNLAFTCEDPPTTLTISGIKDGDSSITSDYFALENIKTHMSIGVIGDTCLGAELELQTTVYGIPSQQFTLEGKK
jgi:hypothetical protein